MYIQKAKKPSAYVFIIVDTVSARIYNIDVDTVSATVCKEDGT